MARDHVLSRESDEGEDLSTPALLVYAAVVRYRASPCFAVRQGIADTALPSTPIRYGQPISVAVTSNIL